MALAEIRAHAVLRKTGRLWGDVPVYGCEGEEHGTDELLHLAVGACFLDESSGEEGRVRDYQGKRRENTTK